MITGGSRGIGVSGQAAESVLAGLPGDGNVIHRPSSAYGASKAAGGAFGQSIAKSLGDLGTAVTTLAPGFVDTDMASASLPWASGGILDFNGASYLRM